MDYLTMNDARLQTGSKSSPYNKGRSKSICAPQNISLEKLASTTESFTRESRNYSSPHSRSSGSGSGSTQSVKTTGKVRKKSTPNLQINQEDYGDSHVSENGSISSSSIQRRKSAQGLSKTQGKNPPSPTTISPYSASGRRKSNAFLEVPNYFHSSLDDEEETVTLRTFSSSKQGVINRGDSFIRRRSRSASLIPPISPLSSPIKIPENLLPIPSGPHDSYLVGMLGGIGVGKASLVYQFRTSECINAYDNGGEPLNEKNISIVLDGTESELNFVFDSRGEKELMKTCDAFLVIYSVVDKSSFNKAEEFLNILQDMDLLRSSACVLVGNKIDLARSRTVSTQDGKFLACTYRIKFIEVSVGININVDDLLAGTLKQIRLKKERYELYGDRDADHWYKNRAIVRASMKARQWISWLFGIEDSKFKNCENLQIL